MQKDEFLKSYKKFQLGVLPTEQPHPDTVGLSQLVKNDLPEAIERLKQVDLSALKQLLEYAPAIEEMRKKCQQVLQSGGRIFLCGCGATGRLSLLADFLFREKFSTDQVISFMAGGDIALVHSLEGFEDYPDRGARHLMQMGFTEKDLLISSTEGGETPFVIGATEKAAEVSQHSPFFLYCNPKEILIDKIERSRKVITNEKVNDICLYVGPMALSGSTRMQASTVLQLALGAAFIETDVSVESLFKEFISEVEDCDFSKLSSLVKKEFEIYRSDEFVMYMPRDFGITVFTDTTERSPTFSLPPFESNAYCGDSPSLCYILLPTAENSAEAWCQLLQHPPHALDWVEIDGQTSLNYLEQFDFSKHSLERREERLDNKRQYLFEIQNKGTQLMMSLAGVELEWQVKTKRSLLKHTLLKLMLNIHSTTMMGLMERYESNIMTWVTATNGKLIDRATRYVRTLLKEKLIDIDYLTVVDKIYEIQPTLNKEECIVLKVIDALTPSEKN